MSIIIIPLTIVLTDCIVSDCGVLLLVLLVLTWYMTKAFWPIISCIIQHQQCGGVMTHYDGIIYYYCLNDI